MQPPGTFQGPNKQEGTAADESQISSGRSTRAGIDLKCLRTHRRVCRSELRATSAAVWRGGRGAGTRLCLDGWLLGLARRRVGLGAGPLDAPTAAARRLGTRILGRTSRARAARIRIPPGLLALIIGLTAPGNAPPIRCRGRNSAGGISRWARAGCHRADRIPS